MQATVNLSHDFVARLSSHNDQVMRPTAELSTGGQLIQDHTIFKRSMLQGLSSAHAQLQLARCSVHVAERFSKVVHNHKGLVKRVCVS